MVACPAWSDANEMAWRAWWKSTPKDEVISLHQTPAIGDVLSDVGAVFVALSEALRGTGSVSPNPLVGCVVRSEDGKFLSSGAHLRVGEAHAERNALSEIAQTSLKGARVLVTLEPCAHQGRTPACADFLASLPLSEVRYLVKDPDPRVNGAGAQRIQDAGIKVVFDQAHSDLGESIAEVFLFNQRQHKVFVGLKAATTKSGVYALGQSSRFWITGQRAREYGHYLRLRYDAVLVGPETVLLDDPSLNVRSSVVSGRDPIRVILDPKNEILTTSKSLKIFSQNPMNTLVIHSDRIKSDSHAKIQSYQSVALALNSEGHFDWDDIKKVLFKVGVRSVLIEGGRGIWESALAHKAVQKLHWFVGPMQDKIPESAPRWEIPHSLLKAERDFKLGVDEYFESVLS